MLSVRQHGLDCFENQVRRGRSSWAGQLIISTTSERARHNADIEAAESARTAHFDLRLPQRPDTSGKCDAFMTPEERNGMKIFGLMILIALLWVLALTVVFRAIGTLDDGPAYPPSAWRN